MLDPHLEPHWTSAALLTIDMQRDFLSDGPYPIAGTTEVLPNLGWIAAPFRASGQPIAHLVRLYPADEQDVDRVDLVQDGADFVRPGTPGRLLAPGLAPVETDLDDERLLKGEPQHVSPNEFLLYEHTVGRRLPHRSARAADRARRGHRHHCRLQPAELSTGEHHRGARAGLSCRVGH